MTKRRPNPIRARAMSVACLMFASLAVGACGKEDTRTDLVVVWTARSYDTVVLAALLPKPRLFLAFATAQGPKGQGYVGRVWTAKTDDGRVVEILADIGSNDSILLEKGDRLQVSSLHKDFSYTSHVIRVYRKPSEEWLRLSGVPVPLEEHK